MLSSSLIDTGKGGLPVEISEAIVTLQVPISITSPAGIILPTLRSTASNVKPPTSMKWIKSIPAPYYLLSIAGNSKKTYFGQENSQLLEVANPLGTHHVRSMVATVSRVSSLQVYKDRIYALCASSPFQVIVSDLNGKELRTWIHNKPTNSYSMMRVVNDKVVIPCDSEGVVYVYNLMGEVQKKIVCPVTNGSWKTMAVCGDDSVIVGDWGYQEGVVFRVNIKRGEVMWTYKQIKAPEGVVCYKDRYVLVGSINNDTRIWILDINTGTGMLVSR